MVPFTSTLSMVRCTASVSKNSMNSGLVIAVVFSSGIWAQAPDPAEATREELEKEVSAQRRILMDWGGLIWYGSDNAELKYKPNPNRVVFLGDEITENWGTGKDDFFPDKPYLNRGILRQTTAQMLVRFRQDVLSLHPKVVVIQAGTNDLGSVMGPMTEGVSTENFITMTELAQSHGIRVVLASILPVCDCFKEMTKRRPPGKIISLNGWLKEYAESNGAVYLDYYSALADGRTFNKDLTVDGLLPNDAGYVKMAVLTEKAIAEALTLKEH